MTTKSTPRLTASFAARIDFNRDIKRIESAPLNERKEGFADWTNALKNDPDIVIERIEWLLDGNYGWGSYELAREVITNPRQNRPAWLGITIAALEWRCPSNYARKAWNELSTDQQNTITSRINAVIEDALQSIAEE